MSQQGGALTFAQKRLLAIKAGSSGVTAGSTTVPPAPASGDVEMTDVSATPSNIENPPSSHSQLGDKPSFSAEAKPFVPPASVAAYTTTPTVTPIKRPPPHRALKVPGPAPSSAAASVATSTANSVTTAASGFDHSAAPSPKRRAGPHAKIATPGDPVTVGTSMESASPTISEAQPQSPVQPPKPVTGNNTQDAWIEAKPEPEPEPEPVTSEPKVKVESPMHRDVDSPVKKPASVEDAVAANALLVQGMNETKSQYDRNDYLPMLLASTDRELVRAFADHIHLGVDLENARKVAADSQLELWMEFARGQRLPATVAKTTAVGSIVEEFAKLLQIDISEVTLTLMPRKREPTS